jgi:ribonuclease HI
MIIHESNISTLTFYTDGSLVNFGNPDIKLGFGWHLVPSPFITQSIEFYASTHGSPSSTKAEIMALLSALIVCPDSSTVTIYTDSQATIDGYNLNVIPNLFLTDRRRLKQHNFLLWSVVLEIVASLNLSVRLRKVKAHSNDAHNDHADNLAKLGCAAPTLVVNYTRSSHHYAFVCWDSIPVEANIRKFINEANTSRIHDDWLNNRTIPRMNSVADQIDWTATFKWIKYTEELTPTSQKQMSSLLFKIQNLNRSLPTLEWLKVRQPHIYGPTWSCCLCNTQMETWDHVYTCFKNSQTLSDIVSLFFEDVCTRTDTLAPLNWYSTKQLLSSTPLFQLPTTSSSQCSIMDLIASVVPKTLTHILSSQGLSRNQVYEVLFPAMNSFYNDLFTKIWKPRCDITIQRQLSMGLTKKAKRIKFRHRSTTTMVAASSRNVISKATPTRWTSWTANSLKFGSSWVNFYRLLEYIQFSVALRMRYGCFTW